ncbi:ArsR/SmtB family transcription factor [Saccharothrix obliqua]|uniref:ArsR/SmtB family transcription factor n=1 Tax=Saccharothrix obliqua TaxID=2861747 RepID=UPI001C5F2C23|nr:metalloregulator ArsR/SmtB family transcription factor [Saccharothrix obliqua]MBW4721446.1 metalloregulator ArsR/SmtB family transcription factor [Saccharothrix obliqua]
MTDVIDGVFAALANSTRRALLARLLEEGDQPVQRLAAHFDMARPSVSEHLKVLKDAGLVSGRRRGRQQIYRLEHEAMASIRDWLAPYELFWRDKLAAMSAVLDEEARAEEEEQTRVEREEPE